MDSFLNTKTSRILSLLNIVAWVAFVGFMVQAGAILFSYTVTCFKPDAAKNLYKGLDMSALYHFNFTYYTLHMAFLIVLLVMKSLVWYLVIKTLSGIRQHNPFNTGTSLMLLTISYVLFATWILGVINNAYNGWLIKQVSDLADGSSTDSFLFMAGLVFIIAQIFKYGVELQSENELTV